MKPRYFSISRRAARKGTGFSIALAFLLLAPSVFAANQYFSDAGGPLSWDTTTMNWGAVTAGPYTAGWTAGNAAIFEGTAGTVNVGSGVASPTVGNLTFSVTGYTLEGGQITLGSNSIIDELASRTTVINSVIGETGGSRTLKFKGGSGSSSVFTLGGANTFTGAVTIEAAKVNFDNLQNGVTASSFGSGTGSVTVCSNASFAVAAYTGAVIGSTDRLFVVGGTGGGTISNNGSAAISFTNTGSAVTGTASARALTLNGSYTAAANTFSETLTDPATAITTTTAAQVAGDTTITVSSTTNIAVGNMIAGTGIAAGTKATAVNTTTKVVTLSQAIVAPGVGSGDTVTISAATTLTVSGNTWNITGANTHSGATTLGTGGVLNIVNANALGTGTFTASGNGSFDNKSVSDLVVANAFTLSGGSPTYVGSANNMTINGAVTLSGANRTLTVTAKTLTLGGAIGEDASSRGLTKAGITGTLILSAPTASTYSGGTTITGGTLAITAANNLGTGTAINLTSSNTATLALAATATGTVQIPATTTVTTTTFTGNFGNQASASTIFDIAAKITGTGNVNRSSGSVVTTGAVRFSNDANDYAGTFSVGFGLTEFTSVANGGSPSSLGAGSGAYSIGNSTSAGNLRYVGASDTTTTRNIDWKATTGGFSIENNGTGSVKFLGTGNFVSGIGAKTLSLSGTNTGANEVAQAINQAASGSTVTAAVFSSGATIVRLTSVDGVTTGAAISGTGIDAGTTVSAINTSTREVTLSTPAIGAGTSGQTMTVTGVVNTTSLVKNGAGKWILSASNTYTGNTTVTGGTLSLGTATLPDASTINIATGAALELTHGTTDTVLELFFNGVQQSPGTYNTANSGGRITGNGSLLVTSGPAPSNTYSTWIAGFSGAAGAPGFSQDADGDGINNGVEHILGTDPSVGSSGLVQVSATATSVKFRHSQTNTLATDVTPSYQWSADLVNWNASGATDVGGTTATIATSTITDNTAPANDEIEVTVSITAGPANKIFARLAGTQP